MKPQRGIAIAILSKKKADDSADDGELSMPAGEEVAQEFIDAVKAGDAKEVWKAFRGMQACAADAEETDETDEAEPDEA